MTLLSSKSNQPCLLISLWLFRYLAWVFLYFYYNKILTEFSSIQYLPGENAGPHFSDFPFFPLRKSGYLVFYYFVILYYTILLLKYRLGQIKHLFELLVPISWCPKALTLLIFSGSMTTANPCETLGYFPSNSYNLALYHRLSLKILALSGMLRKQPPLPDMGLVTVSRTLKACKVQAGKQIRGGKKYIYIYKGNIPTFSLLSSSSPPPADQREIASSQIPKISGLLASAASCMGDSFSTSQGQGMVPGWFKHVALAVHFISVTIITSAPPRIIRHQTPQVGAPSLKGLLHLLALSWALFLPLSHKPLKWRESSLILCSRLLILHMVLDRGESS